MNLLPPFLTLSWLISPMACLSIAEAAGTCLGLCARVVGDELVGLIVPYVTQNIQVRVILSPSL